MTCVVKSSFSSRFQTVPIDNGHVNIAYRSYGDHPGLWVSTFGGFDRRHLFADGDVMSFQWCVVAPGTELLTTATLVAIGVMPLEVFADWLDDHRDTYQLQCKQFDDDPPDQWGRVTAEMRRIAGVATSSLT